MDTSNSRNAHTFPQDKSESLWIPKERIRDQQAWERSIAAKGEKRVAREEKVRLRGKEDK